MKKKIIAVLLGVILCMSVAACSGDSYSSIKVEGAQDYSYAVTGNGGNAVQYGNYVYFVNGYRGDYDDTDGTKNVWGNVVKGALYRAEMKGTKDGRDFIVARDETTGLDFTTSKALGLDQKVVDSVDVQVIAPKTIGTSGFSGGGIFIFDEYVYYASPNNQKDKSGTVQSAKTDFFRTRLDGGKTEKLFTTAEDSASKPYGFYKYNGFVYLVVLDGTSLKSVKIGGRKIEVTEIANSVDSAVFPIKSVYYDGIGQNGVEDFVYFTRTADKDDLQRAGNVLEAIRPDGSERGIFWENGAASSIEGVRDGLVFYRTVVNGTNTVIRYSNLHNFFTSDYDYTDNKGAVQTAPLFPSYKNSEETAGRTNVEGDALNMVTATLTAYTYTYAMRPNPLSNEVYVVCADTTGIYLFNGAKSKKIYTGTANVKRVEGNYVYFTDSDETNIIYRTNVFTDVADKGDETKETLTGNTKFNGSGLDICAGYLVYFADIDSDAPNYTYFYELSGLAGREPIFMGVRSKDDAPGSGSTDSGDTAE